MVGRLGAMAIRLELLEPIATRLEAIAIFDLFILPWRSWFRQLAPYFVRAIRVNETLQHGFVADAFPALAKVPGGRTIPLEDAPKSNCVEVGAKSFTR